MKKFNLHIFVVSSLIIGLLACFCLNTGPVYRGYLLLLITNALLFGYALVWRSGANRDEWINVLEVSPQDHMARVAKYEDKLSIDGTFDQLMTVNANYTPRKKEAAEKSAKKAIK